MDNRKLSSRRSMQFFTPPSQKLSQSRLSFSSASRCANEQLFDTLMNDPGKRDIVLQLLMQDKKKLEELKHNRHNLMKNFGQQSPFKKAKQKFVCESPSALLRRRALEKRNGAGQTASVSHIVKPSPLPFERLLQGVVAYVEVKSNDCDRSSGAKALMQAMGAIVRDSFTYDVTHVVFKDGSFNTYQKAKLMKTELVSVLWLEAIRRNHARVPEKNYPALGTDVFKTNISMFCEEMQRDYEDVVRDELNRSIVVNIRNRQQNNALQVQSSSFDTRVDDSMEDLIDASQNCDAVSVISKSSRYLAKDKVNKMVSESPDSLELRSSPDLTDSDSELGIINGRSVKKVHNFIELGDDDCELSQKKASAGSVENASSESTSLLAPAPNIKANESKTRSRRSLYNFVSVEDALCVSPKQKRRRTVHLQARDGEQELTSRSSCQLSFPLTDNFVTKRKTRQIGSLTNESGKKAEQNIVLHSLQISDDNYIDPRDKICLEKPSEFNKMSCATKAKKNSSNKLNSKEDMCAADEKDCNDKDLLRKSNPSFANHCKAQDLSDSDVFAKSHKVSASSEEMCSLQISIDKSNSLKSGKKSIDKDCSGQNSKLTASGKRKRNDSVPDTASNRSRKSYKSNLSNSNILLQTVDDNISLSLEELRDESPPKKVRSKKQECENNRKLDITNLDKENDVINADPPNQKSEENSIIQKVTKRQSAIKPKKGQKVKLNHDNTKTDVRNNVSTWKTESKNRETTIADKKTHDSDDTNPPRGKSNFNILLHTLNDNISLSLEELTDNSPPKKIKSKKQDGDNNRKPEIVNLAKQNDVINADPPNQKSEENSIIQKVTKRQSIIKPKKGQKVKLNDDNTTTDVRNNASTSKTENKNSERTIADKQTPDSVDTNPSKNKIKMRRLYNLNNSVDEASIPWNEKDKDDKKKENVTDTIFKKPACVTLAPVQLTASARAYIEKLKTQAESVLCDKNLDTFTNNADFKTSKSTKNPNHDEHNARTSSSDITKKTRDSKKVAETPKTKNKKEGKFAETPNTKSKINGKNIVPPSRKSVRVQKNRRNSDVEDSLGSDFSIGIKPQKNRRSTLDFVPKIVKTPAKIKSTQNNLVRKSSVVCTRFHSADVQLFQQIVKKLGKLFVEDEVTEKTTHLVAGESKRTINMLRAIARGCWILKAQWMYMSLEAGKWLPEEDFELSEFSPAVQQCRQQRQAFGTLYSMDIFESCGPIYIARCSIPRHSDLEDLIVLCKGNVTKIQRNAAIVVGDFDKRSNVVSVVEKWVLDSVMFNKKKSFKNYLLKTPNLQT